MSGCISYVDSDHGVITSLVISIGLISNTSLIKDHALVVLQIHIFYFWFRLKHHHSHNKVI